MKRTCKRVNTISLGAQNSAHDVEFDAMDDIFMFHLGVNIIFIYVNIVKLLLNKPF
jgi:hypothetical protein